MWRLTTVDNPLSAKLWFSDGLPITNTIRGGQGESSRLIVEGQGFVDFSEFILQSYVFLDVNGLFICSQDTLGADTFDIRDKRSPWIDIALSLPGQGRFTITVVQTDTGIHLNVTSLTGILKPLPTVSAYDANFLTEMIAQKYVPYQNIPDAPGKTEEEIRELGTRLFPFTPYSFELAMSVYDWTTASFARIVFMKIFQYTAIPETPLPLDGPSIADSIWESNWGSYIPQSPDYMNSFMMKPASTLADVKAQLESVTPKLHEFSNVQNRLLAAAMQALPRTSLIAKPRLFSGQVDISQLGMERFGIEFLECPLNKGPVTESLVFAFADAMGTYISQGHVITTKMVWSFTDSLQDAMHYENGILLVADIPDDSSWVWETAAHITPLSDDSAKTEYTFAPGSQFKVLSTEQVVISEKQMVVINLRPEPLTQTPSAASQRERLQPTPLVAEEFRKDAGTYTPVLEKRIQLIDERKGVIPASSMRLPVACPDATHFKLAHKTRGRRCRCIDALDNMGSDGVQST
ncbi:uncharacterized protein FIBRA_02598 [Fibroporia radiculosa]|uniref:Uncharacterized protein n=1 Tax=Fibroporia radiculosa TaxID=599839 RepID=J4H1Y1_9APHY|nr:uncharacterized protein FIBRA_02598 [Fibroporia radiculosa]CCM00564.1 predicted protein [Fibroporia radiculosa]